MATRAYDPDQIPSWTDIHPEHRAAVVRELESRLAELYAQNAAATATQNAADWRETTTKGSATS